MKIKDTSTNIKILKKTLQKKCTLRSAPFPKIDLIQNHNNRKLLESEWTIQLRHQMPELPPFEQFISELGRVLEWVS